MCTTRKEAGSTLHAWAGVLWISSDEDDRSYFWGFEIFDPRILLVGKFVKFFWGWLGLSTRDFSKKI